MANYFNLIQSNPTNSELSKIANKSCIVLSCVSVGIESLSKHLMIGEERMNVCLIDRCHFPAVHWSIPHSHSFVRKTRKQDRQVCSHVVFSNFVME